VNKDEEGLRVVSNDVSVGLVLSIIEMYPVGAAQSLEQFVERCFSKIAILN